MVLFPMALMVFGGLGVDHAADAASIVAVVVVVYRSTKDIFPHPCSILRETEEKLQIPKDSSLTNCQVSTLKFQN